MTVSGGGSYSFSHDSFARMASDGRSGTVISYNPIDLPQTVYLGSSVKVQYSYMADGSKIAALKPSGEGLLYRGPFTYRVSTDSSGGTPVLVTTLESVPSAGGRLTPGGALHYVTAQEDQWPDFSVPYTDFGARQYNVNLRRWMVPDPMGEAYYDISPYVYCAGDPVKYLDPEGRSDTIFS